ncbi:MAG: ribonuclease P protein component, partial [Candidatus Methylomirabilales bacterium]
TRQGADAPRGVVPMGVRPQMGQRFSRADRIRATREFQAAVRGGEKVSLRGLSLYVHRRPGSGKRLGLAVAGRLGGAVARNRIKRRLREYVRRHRDQMAEGVDLIVVVHRDLSRVDPDAFRTMMGDLFTRAKLFQHPPRKHAEEFVHTAS